MISALDFRSGIEELLDYETNPIARVRIRRALRNDRVFSRWLGRVNDMAENNGFVDAFDFESLKEFLAEHWDEIAKLLLTLLLMFI